MNKLTVGVAPSDFQFSFPLDLNLFSPSERILAFPSPLGRRVRDEGKGEQIFNSFPSPSIPLPEGEGSLQSLLAKGKGKLEGPGVRETGMAPRLSPSRTAEIAMTVLKMVCVLALLPHLQACIPLVAAGIGTGVLVAEDRRTTGTYIEDQNIDLKANSRINEKYKDKAHINVSSYNRIVLLTGEVSDQTTKADVEKIVRGVDNVRDVVNELVIAGSSPFTSRANDTFITTKVKARIVDANKVPANAVKVVTENGTVYLRGLVTKQEADLAVETVRNTSGVQKVVKVFEYIPVAPKKNPPPDMRTREEG